MAGTGHFPAKTISPPLFRGHLAPAASLTTQWVPSPITKTLPNAATVQSRVISRPTAGRNPIPVTAGVKKSRRSNRPRFRQRRSSAFSGRDKYIVAAAIASGDSATHADCPIAATIDTSDTPPRRPQPPRRLRCCHRSRLHWRKIGFFRRLRSSRCHPPRPRLNQCRRLCLSKYHRLLEALQQPQQPQQFHGHSRPLHVRRNASTTPQVLPSIRAKHDEFMLGELVKRWLNHTMMARWLSRYSHYLDRYFIARRSLSPLNEVGLTRFREMVYKEIHEKVRDVVNVLIDHVREGEQIDHALLKKVLDIFVEVRMGSTEFSVNDFDDAMLKDTSSSYRRKASNWILEDLCPDSLLKAEDGLKRAKDGTAHYLHSSSEQKLLEKVQHQLLTAYEGQLPEKEQSGCHVLLRDKDDDLSRMHRLFSKIQKGLDPVAQIFKQHVTDEGMALVKQADDAANNKKVETRVMVGLHVQVFVRKVIELHDKYLASVNVRFMNHSLFHKALKEAFEVFCNQGVAGSSSAELLAIHDHMLQPVIGLLSFCCSENQKEAALLIGKIAATDSDCMGQRCCKVTY